MTPIGGDDPVMSNRALADLGLDDATRADFEACWDTLCAAPPPELAEAHIHAAAAVAARAAAHPRFTSSGRSLAKAAVISAAAFVGTTGLAAADVLPPAAVHVVETVANTVRDAVDPIPPELSTPAPAPAPAVQRARRTATTAADDHANAPDPTLAAANPVTTVAVAPSTSMVDASTTVTTAVHDVTSTTGAIVDRATTPDDEGSSTTTTTAPDDGTAVAAGTGSTTTTSPGSSATTTTQPSSSTTTPTPSTSNP